MPGKVRFWVEDEAGFGRISKPKQCWCPKGVRPVVKCQHVRQYRQCYGMVEPMTGEKFFRVFEKCNADSMEIFLEMLVDQWPEDYHILLCDRASWHTLGGDSCLSVPQTVGLIHIPPGTPEMNPMEQIWREIRTQGFHNQYFPHIDSAIDRLCITINNLAPETIKSITQRDWIVSMFSVED